MCGLYRLWVLPTLELAFGVGSSKVLTFPGNSEIPKKNQRKKEKQRNRGRIENSIYSSSMATTLGLQA